MPHTTQQELDLKLNRVHYHTDSTTVLHYIFSDVKRFPVFVAYRVQLIRDYSSTNQWYYVDTNNKTNPADYASRGLDAKQITPNECWLKGPAFIWTPESTWPDQPILLKDYNIDIEHEVVTAVTLIDDYVTTMATPIHYYSDWLRLKKVWQSIWSCFRFSDNVVCKSLIHLVIKILQWMTS